MVQTEQGTQGKMLKKHKTDPEIWWDTFDETDRAALDKSSK